MKCLCILLVGAGLALASCADPSTDDRPDAAPDLVDPVEGVCDATDPDSSDPFADCVEAFEPAAEVSFGHDALPSIVLGSPRGAGEGMGGIDVVSLGCGGSITLHFSAPWPTDRPGPDLAIFENAFLTGDSAFVEPAQVLVSDDGIDWYAFPCDPPDVLDGCAGLRPVLPIEPDDDPAAAGGDVFDLEDVGLAEARWVRLVDRTAEHYGSETWCLGASGGFDLDAVAALEAAP